MHRTLIVVLSAAVLLVPACGGPTGRYTIDHDATLETVGPRFGNGPGGRAGFVAAVRGLSIILELESDGRFVNSCLDASNHEVDVYGRWRLEGNVLDLGGNAPPGVAGPVTLEDGGIRFRLENPAVEVVLRK